MARRRSSDRRTLISVPPEQLVGPTSAPPEGGAIGIDELAAGEQDRAWFFKLFALRGLHEGVERMRFFVFMHPGQRPLKRVAWRIDRVGR
jgi:hypothetical protein